MSPHTVIQGICSLLTGLTDTSGTPLLVVVGDDPTAAYAAQNLYHRAHLWPTSWAESDQLVAGKLAVTVYYQIELTTVLNRRPDEDAEAVIDALAERICTAVNGCDLGGTWIPRLSRVTDGRYTEYGRRASTLTPPPSPARERRIWLSAKGSYLRA